MATELPLSELGVERTDGFAAQRPIVAGLLVLIAVVVVSRWPAWRSMAGTWLTNDTFGHTVLVLPLSAWLVWRARHRLWTCPVRPSPAGLLLIVLLCGVDVLGGIGGLKVVEQFAAVALIPAAVWTVLGTSVFRVLAFPLGYLLFAIPVGEELVPLLVEFTADFIVTGLQLFGIPVFRDGALLMIPSGDFEVARECSGVRYLLASVMLGSLFAYLYLRPAWRLIAFLLLSVTVPVIANSLRALGIVLIAHFSEMQLAIGIDHLVYGWLFFGVVMALLFMLGRAMREDGASPRIGAEPAAGAGSPAGAWATLAAAAVIVLVTPATGVAMATNIREGIAEIPPRGLPVAAQDWRGPYPPVGSWRPAYRSPDLVFDGEYRSPSGTVVLHVFYYSHSPGAPGELINDLNAIYDAPTWATLQHVADVLDTGGTRLEVARAELRGERETWYWFDVAGAPLVSPVDAKWWQLRALLRGESPGGSLVALSTDARAGGVELRRRLLQDFLSAHLPAIEACVRARRTANCQSWDAP